MEIRIVETIPTPYYCPECGNYTEYPCVRCGYSPDGVFPSGQVPNSGTFEVLFVENKGLKNLETELNSVITPNRSITIVKRHFGSIKP